MVLFEGQRVTRRDTSTWRPFFGISSGSQVLDPYWTDRHCPLSQIVTADEGFETVIQPLCFIWRKKIAFKMVWPSEIVRRSWGGCRAGPIYLIPCHTYTSLYLNRKGKLWQRINSKKIKHKNMTPVRFRSWRTRSRSDASGDVYWSTSKKVHHLVR